MSNEIEQLEEFAQLENSELGEFWQSLVDLTRHKDFMSDGFYKSLKAEIKGTLKYIKKNFDIIVEPAEVVHKEYKRLKHKNED